MTITEATNFYRENEKKYIVKDNEELLDWIKEQNKFGYHFNIEMNISSIQSLINKIANWYIIKYPFRELEKDNGIIYPDFSDVTSISPAMTFRRLEYHLLDNELWLLECPYRAKCGGPDRITLFIPKKHPQEYEPKDIIISADDKTGLVYSHDWEYDDYKDTTLKTLYKILYSEYDNEYDLTELKECIFTHECDLELRKKILQLVALKLLYSKRDSNPEMGYTRAQRFINEFNKELGLDLSTDEIDLIMNRDYSKDTKKGKVRKKRKNKKGVSR